MKKSKPIISLILVVILLFNLSPLQTHATNIIYMVSVTPVQQAKSNWCWAACSEMAGKTMYSSSSRTQYSVVDHIYGYAPNLMGTLGDVVEGSKYVAYYTRSFASSFSAWMFSSLENHISQGKPVTVGLGYYSNGQRIGGHMVVITGTAHVEDSTGSYWFIYYIDPDDGSGYSKSYSTFCNDNGQIIYDATVYVSN